MIRIKGLLRAARRSLFIKTEETPNANSLKFKTGHTVMREGVREFTRPAEAVVSPLADELFKIDGVRSVFYGPDFVTVSKDDRFTWEQVRPSVFAAIMSQYTVRGEDLFPARSASARQGTEEEMPTDGSPETVKMIKEILDTRIRPVVQQDGGDVEYRGFVKGHVRLKMQGACRSCSSSVITLRNGIENMLMHYIPEVLGVEQVTDEMDEVSMKAFRRVDEGKYPRDDDDDDEHDGDHKDHKTGGDKELLNVVKTKPRRQ